MARPYFAFFDVDYTLLDGSTGSAFGRELVRAGIVGPSDLARVLLWSSLYKLGWIDEVAIWHRSTERLVGKPEIPIRQACEGDFFAKGSRPWRVIASAGRSLH
jgi:hypothetical protein